jgi:hypothetical protein
MPEEHWNAAATGTRKELSMTSEIFRFAIVRPPQQNVSGGGPDGVVNLGQARSALTDTLRRLRASGARSAMADEANKFIASPDFIDSPDKLDKKLTDFAMALGQLPDRGFWSAAQHAFDTTFQIAPSSFVNTDGFTRPYVQIADSIVAAAIEISVLPKVRGLLSSTARTLWLIRRLANAEPLSQNAFTAAPLVLPAGIFPLPAANADLLGQRKAQAEAVKAAIEARQKRLAQLAAELGSYRQAVDELVSVFEHAGAQQPAVNTVSSRIIGPTGSIATPAGFLLTELAATSLGTPTREALAQIGLSTTEVDVAKSVMLLEKKAADTARRLYAGSAVTGTMVRVGGSLFPKDVLSGGWTVVVDPGPGEMRTPGPCPPIPPSGLPDGAVTVPDTHGDARILGIADLMVVEQELKRYQLGEISRIENVLRSEVRSRTVKTTDTIEQSQTIETETTEEKEKDLASTDRFELQTESQTVISESASKQAGLTIHASYGPSVDATANFNTSTSTSTQQANSASSNYAREVTTKAVDRVQMRTLTRRTVTITHVIEETNEHGFDNKTGTADIVGIYRFVDKIYSAQVVNYGKRLMVEFIVPEPAAFLRYALTNRPIQDVPQVKPDPPGYCLANGTTFVPLQATDIDREHYLYWASKYNARDIAPPPPSIVIASGSQKSPDTLPTVPLGGEEAKLGHDLLDVTIPDGYLCQSAFVNVYGETQAPPPGSSVAFVFQIQKQRIQYVNDPVAVNLDPAPTLTVGFNSKLFHNYEILVAVLCTLSTEKFQDWQFKTFASIMNAYNDLKSAYDEAVREAQLRQADGTAFGTNPENNRITEQTELKKGCIALLTGQRFDLFDAVTPNIAPYGYPEIDFAEAKAEGSYIQFFEQSFEWNNVVYLFYPYFWSRKDEWASLVQLTDNDPLFQQFLVAGAARVQVPVRPGFNDAILTYLATGQRWPGEGVLINAEGGGPDRPTLSIVDELKGQTGNNHVDGVGTIKVIKNSAAVAGNGTEFTADDVNRRIIVAGITYIIKTVTDAQTIALASPYSGDSAEDLGYALGGKLVGQPWEIKLPTDLVKLDASLTIT